MDSDVDFHKLSLFSGQFFAFWRFDIFSCVYINIIMLKYMKTIL